MPHLQTQAVMLPSADLQAESLAIMVTVLPQVRFVLAHSTNLTLTSVAYILGTHGNRDGLIGAGTGAVAGHSGGRESTLFCSPCKRA